MPPTLKLVTIYYHEEDSAWWADSPDVPGWTCLGDSLEEVRQLAFEGVREFVGDDCAINEALPETESPYGVFGVAPTGTLTIGSTVSMQLSASFGPRGRTPVMPARPLQDDDFDITIEQAI